MTAQMTAIDENVSVILFITLYKMPFHESLDEIIGCDHSNESSQMKAIESSKS